MERFAQRARAGHAGSAAGAVRFDGGGAAPPGARWSSRSLSSAETLVIQTVTPSAATTARSTAPTSPTSARRPASSVRPSQPPLRAERRVDDQEVRARRAAQRRDHARNVDLEEHDRRQQRDQQRKPAGGVPEERVQRGRRVRAEQTGVRGRDDERDGEQKRNAERNDPGDLVVPTRRHARLPANASHCH